MNLKVCLSLNPAFQMRNILDTHAKVLIETYTARSDLRDQAFKNFNL